MDARTGMVRTVVVAGASALTLLATGCVSTNHRTYEGCETEALSVRIAADAYHRFVGKGSFATSAQQLVDAHVILEIPSGVTYEGNRVSFRLAWAKPCGFMTTAP